MQGTFTGYTFLDGGGETVVDGKSHWPHIVTMRMDRYQAFGYMQILLQQLCNEEREKIILHFTGELKEDEVEE
jgi:hypothetical protein